jgi:hypothetical protein
MLPTEVAEYASEIKEAFIGVGSNARVGFHGHDNLSLSTACSLSAIQAGCDIVDGSLLGIGRSIGNAATEVLAMVLAGACWRLLWVVYLSSGRGVEGGMQHVLLCADCTGARSIEYVNGLREDDTPVYWLQRPEMEAVPDICVGHIDAGKKVYVDEAIIPSGSLHSVTNAALEMFVGRKPGSWNTVIETEGVRLLWLHTEEIGEIVIIAFLQVGQGDIRLLFYASGGIKHNMNKNKDAFENATGHVNSWRITIGM